MSRDQSVVASRIGVYLCRFGVMAERGCPRARGTKARLLAALLGLAAGASCGGGGLGPSTVHPQAQLSAQLSPGSLFFGTQQVGITSVTQLVTLVNSGSAAVNVSGVNTSGDFSQTNNCPSTLAVAAVCLVNVAFTPTTTGARTGTLSIITSAASAAQTVSLSGAGAVAEVGFSSAGLSFPAQPVSTVSAAQTETLTDTGKANLIFSAVTISGANATDFAISADTCTRALLSPNNSCAITVVFTPSTTGSRSATLSFKDDTSSSPQAINLTGFGTGLLAGVFTQRYDNARSGQNTQEAYLTASNVTQSRFGKLFSLPVDGQVYAQPLYMGSVSIPNQGVHNVVYVATENDSVYAFDADAPSSAPLWHVNFVNPSNGVTTIPSEDLYGVDPKPWDIVPQLGITSTPVIDPARGTLYVTARTREPIGSSPSCASNGAYEYCYRLHALDITTGAEKFGGPALIAASVPGTGYDSAGGSVTFSGLMQLQRAGLLLQSGIVYLGFGSQYDNDPYHGWLMAYDAATLQQVAVFNVTPNGQKGGIWQAGAGIAADTNGFLYVVTANGTFDANTPGGLDYADSVLKMQLQAGQLKVLDYFTPANEADLEATDLDLGTSPALILPDQAGPYPHLLATAGKDGRIWLINRDNLGQFQANDAGAVEVIPPIGSDSLYGGMTYWNGNLYIQEFGASLNQFFLNNGVVPQAPSCSTAEEFGVFPNYLPVVSAKGESNAVLWLVSRSAPGGAAILHAFDATDVSIELYNSTQASNNRDQAGTAVKFTVPTVANGKVYLGTATEVEVYGLLP